MLTPAALKVLSTWAIMLKNHNGLVVSILGTHDLIAIEFNPITIKVRRVQIASEAVIAAKKERTICILLVIVSLDINGANCKMRSNNIPILYLYITPEQNNCLQK